MPAWGAEKITEIFHWFAQGGYEPVTSDVEEVLGRKPYSFEEFIEAFKDKFE